MKVGDLEEKARGSATGTESVAAPNDRGDHVKVPFCSGGCNIK